MTILFFFFSGSDFTDIISVSDSFFNRFIYGEWLILGIFVSLAFCSIMNSVMANDIREEVSKDPNFWYKSDNFFKITLLISFILAFVVIRAYFHISLPEQSLSTVKEIGAFLAFVFFSAMLLFFGLVAGVKALIIEKYRH